ncbi:MAG: Sua5/YciO/YrdC/YwlC family protein, partial [Acidobacteriaceae bacterium]
MSYSFQLPVRRQIRVRGIVQGVGFRPFVYNSAQTLGLSGHVLNSSNGVFIEVEGLEATIAHFLETLRQKAPPLAQIDEITVTEMPIVGDTSFIIRESRAIAGQFALIPSDIGTCEDCWRDFSDPANRRYGYPFTNCTNCGPRYTIIQDIPYDRPKTTMACFPMCALCQSEYENPKDRRFHAQPNACPVCGPGLALVQDPLLHEPASFNAEDALVVIRRGRAMLREGRIVAVKGLGGFLLACDAQNDEAVRAMRERKRRSDKPFAVMARDIDSIEQFCTVSEADRAALLDPRRAIVVLPRRPDTEISEAVAPGNDTIGVMLPYTPLHYLLFSDAGDQPAEFAALVMTSGNISEEPIVTGN